jgi:hypothetical protein
MLSTLLHRSGQVGQMHSSRGVWKQERRIWYTPTDNEHKRTGDLPTSAGSATDSFNVIEGELHVERKSVLVTKSLY